MILHTVNKTTAWAKCSGLITEQDEVVMLEDGVYLALSEIKTGHAIRADVEARGLLKRLPKHVRLIDYPDFVRLCIEADKICAWF